MRFVLHQIGIFIVFMSLVLPTYTLAQTREKELPDVIIRAMDARSLLQFSVNKSSENYIFDQNVEGYYREYLYQNDKILNFSEGKVQYRIADFKTTPFIHFPESRVYKYARDNSRIYFINFNVPFIITRSIPAYLLNACLTDYKDYKFTRVAENDSSIHINIAPKFLDIYHCLQVDAYIHAKDSLLNYCIFHKAKHVKQFEVAFNDQFPPSFCNEQIDSIQYQSFNGKFGVSYIKYFADCDIVTNANDTLKNLLTTTELKILPNSNIPKVKKHYYHNYLFENGTHYKSKFWLDLEKVMPLPKDENFLKAYKEILQSRQN